MWQKCPICNGTGKYNNPLTMNTQDNCRTCNGKGIISQITGLPPNGVEIRPISRDSGDFRDNCEQFEDK